MQKMINLQNNSISALVSRCCYYIIIESESSNVNVVSLSAAMLSDFKVNTPRLKGNINRSVKVDFMKEVLFVSNLRK